MAGSAIGALRHGVTIESCYNDGRMPPRRFIMNAGRTTKQGQQINVGKDSAEYQATVSTVTMHPDDMKEAGLRSGGSVRIKTEQAEVVFTCVEGKVPQGMIFVPYGPPTCHLMGRTTDGTGMPTSKGWEVEIEAVT
jgi:formylmethanofuran dehydrogenase subunit D